MQILLGLAAVMQSELSYQPLLQPLSTTEMHHFVTNATSAFPWPSQNAVAYDNVSFCSCTRQ